METHDRSTCSWFKLDLGNGINALAPTKEIQQAFTAMLISSGAVHSEWALFSRYDLAADNVELYFTPALGNLAGQFNAYPCEKPILNENRMSLVCGEGGGMLVHFPNQPVYQG